MADKVKFGIKNVHIFPISSWSLGVPTYGAAIAVPGAVSLSLDAQGDINKFYGKLILQGIDMNQKERSWLIKRFYENYARTTDHFNEKENSELFKDKKSIV